MEIEIKTSKDWSDIQVIESKKKESSSYVHIFHNISTKMYLSPKFLDEMKANYFTIGISKRNDAIILFPHEEEQEGSRKIVRRGKGRGNTFSVQTLFNHFWTDKEYFIGNYIPEYEQICQDVYGWVIYIHEKI